MRPAQPLSLLVGIVILAAGCGPAVHVPEPQPPAVTAAPAIRRQVVDYDEYTGRIQSPESVDVRAHVTGYLEEVKFNDGDMVQEKELLMVIDPSTYKTLYDQAKAQIEVWRSKFVFAEATRVRNEGLVGKGSVTKEEYERTVAERNEAAASQVAAEAEAESRRLDWEFCFVKSPIAGRIDRRFVTKGNLVQSGPAPTLLTRIVSIDPIYVYFDVDEQAYLRYTQRRQHEEGVVNRVPLREKHIPVQVTLADDSIYHEPGVIDFASNQVDASTGTITARAVVANHEATLTPGLFVRVKVTSGPPYEAILVAEQAIGTDQSEKYVYVLGADNKPQRRAVVLGTQQGHDRVIKQGVQEGEKVIINGLLLVRPDRAVTVTAGQMPEPPPIDERLLRPEVSPGAAPHEVKKPSER